MRKLVITQNITLDGSIEMLGDWFDPQSQDEELLAETHRQDAECDAMLLGRQTFEDFRSYWPIQSDDQTGITDYLNDVAKYVVSTTMTDPQWKNSTVIDGDPVRRVRELKAAARQGHRFDRQHQPGSYLDRGGRCRRVPPDGVPRRPGSRPPTVPRRRVDVGPGVGRAAEVVSFRHHAAALRGGLKPSIGPPSITSLPE